jgi:hypothetical protein
MWSNDEEMSKEAERVFNKYLRYGYMSIGIEFQERLVEELVELKGYIEQYRTDAIARKDEQAANAACIIGIYADAFHEMCLMWIHFKTDKMQSAWWAMVTAQECLESGLKLFYRESLHELNRHLHAIEKLLFPKQSYVSSSLLFDSAKCNICDSIYGECDHLKGKPYMGIICIPIVNEITGVDHIAFVEDPQDKRLNHPILIDGKQCCSLTYRIQVLPDPTQARGTEDGEPDQP